MKLALFQADAFTSVPFGGNPAAVCLLDYATTLSDQTMLKIAGEMNLSETAFVKVLAEGESHSTASNFGLRWFTPTTEVPLCGHATLASSGVLFQAVGNKSRSITFQTLTGELRVARDVDNLISMDLPRTTCLEVTDDVFSLTVAIASNGLPVHSVHLSTGTKKLLVRLSDDVSRAALEELSIDITALHKSHNGSVFKGVIVSTVGEGKEGGYDFLSRYFAPWNGIDEDPVTGSAHTVLASYWSAALNKAEFNARQCSSRGGDLRVVLSDTAVTISGPVTIIFDGALYL